MAEEIEISEFDLRYETYRMRNPALEARLLTSIVQRGIEEPLEGVDAENDKILLNGFKRYRCAKKLKIGFVPYVSLGKDEVTGILGLIKASNNKTLAILEQAQFIDDLHGKHNMNVSQIAETLSRSKSWVTMRLNLIGEMSEDIREIIFHGDFPMYSYMYTVKKFMHGDQKKEAEEFIKAVSGKKLSTREIEQLAQGYFRGPASFREEIRNGKISLALKQIRQVPENPEGCSEFERVFLNDLQIVQKYMLRVMGKSHNRKLTTRVFFAQANLLAAGILSRIGMFQKTLKELYDRTGKAQSDIFTASGGNGPAGDRTPFRGEP
jgi:hypothetical protein